MKIIGFVYMITSPTGRIYIGSTKNIQNRWNSYKKLRCKDQPKLYNSFMKYTVENHSFEIIWKGDINDMLKYEYLLGHYLDALNIHTGMNCKLPTWGEAPICFSEDTLKRMSESRSGNKNPMFGLKGELNPNYLRKCSKESKDRMSKAQSGKKLSEETKLKIGLKSKGKKHTELTKIKMSKNNGKYFLGKEFSEDHRNNIGISLRGKVRGPMTEKHKSNLSKSKLGKKQNLDHKLKSVNAANKPIIQYDLKGNFIKEWKSAAEAGRELKLKSFSGITAVCKSKRKTAGNFKWKYK